VRAINDYFTHGFIEEETYTTYVQVTIGDILRWNKRETYLSQLIRRINESLCSQVSWRSLQKKTDIGSPNTVREYVDVLKESFVLSPFYVLDRGMHGPNFGKNKKIHFHDPFIFHALRGWVNQTPFYESALEFLRSNEKPKLIECIVGDHLMRFAFSLNPTDTFEPTSHVMYWKDRRNEVDFVVKYSGDYMPFEVKYSPSFSRRDINGVYNFTKGGSNFKGIVVTKDLLGATKGVVAVPAPVLLTLF
jgi:predicted AAA+ superfamily ATPase